MIDLSAVIADDAVFPAVDVHSKKHAVQEFSAVAARLTGLSEREIFDNLLQRERLGSTGIGGGIAIPHGKLVGLDKLFGAFFRLQAPIEFDALDDKPVDLVFVLLAPDDAGSDHLKALAKIARTMRTPGMADSLRKATSPSELHQLLTRSPAPAS